MAETLEQCLPDTANVTCEACSIQTAVYWSPEMVGSGPTPTHRKRQDFLPVASGIGIIWMPRLIGSGPQGLCWEKGAQVYCPSGAAASAPQPYTVPHSLGFSGTCLSSGLRTIREPRIPGLSPASPCPQVVSTAAKYLS